jgi:hypothetical protein
VDGKRCEDCHKIKPSYGFPSEGKQRW